MSAEGWPHGTHVSSARERRLAAFYGRVVLSYAELADIRELIELGASVEEVAASYDVSPERVRKQLGISDGPTPSGLSGSSAVAHPPRRARDAGAGTSPLAPASENAKEQT